MIQILQESVHAEGFVLFTVIKFVEEAGKVPIS